ncbi:hypothetical protein [Thalassotalea sp. PS06]|uniref:hypothetical protein n=1 Tax=Thalassotalea sp. PS06 TaxID=2594005 RepID=UPI001162CC37|nr:hypothetical protein [Thalassotalea sp. PS06]QDP00730.1 hypothetical protein FNC98_04795 [Thalassotalea sp. PS06]
MSLNRKQFDYLQEMGISVWSAREEKFSSLESGEDNPVIIDQSDKILARLNTLKNSPDKKPEAKAKQASKARQTAEQHYQSCIDSQWFKDLLRWLEIEADQVRLDADGIHFDKFTWQFHRKQKIEFVDFNIKSPSFAEIAPDEKQKRQLFVWFKSNR